jgi:hypothetical protein
MSINLALKKRLINKIQEVFVHVDSVAAPTDSRKEPAMPLVELPAVWHWCSFGIFGDLA